jgi:hypothetical protein
MPLHSETDFTFTRDGRCRMTIVMDLGSRHNADLIIADFPAEVQEAYANALMEADKNAGEMERTACVAYDSSRGV